MDTRSCSHETRCATCRRLRDNCCLSPLTLQPLPLEKRTGAECPYYIRRTHPPVEQDLLWRKKNPLF